MNHHHPSVGQVFECFGIGLTVVAAVLLVLIVVSFLFYLAEAPVKCWILRHPRTDKALAAAGWAILGLFVTFSVYYLGCAIVLILEGR